jgi:hypothetical protein
MALTRPRYSQIYDTDYKQSVRLATTTDVGNLAVTGSTVDEVDGVTVAVGDRILVKNQSDGKQNGIYEVLVVGTGSNGTWRRALDADANDKVTSGMTTIVTAGTANSNKTFRLTTADPITLGATSLTFADPFTAGSFVGGANTAVQFNDAGTLAGDDAGFAYFKGNDTIRVGNVRSTGNVIGGNIYADGFFYANGQPFVSSNYGNTDVGVYLTTYGGNILASNINANTGVFTGNIDAEVINGTFVLADFYLTANGGPVYANTQVQTYLDNEYLSGITTNIIPSGSGFNTLGNITDQWGEVWVSNSGLYIDSKSISIAGNTFLIAGYPIDAGSTYSNSNVASYLTVYGGNISAGHITANSLTMSGAGNSNISGVDNLSANSITASAFYYANGQSILTNVQNALNDLTANAALQAGDLSSLYSNAAFQAGEINTLYSNAAAQAGDLTSLYSNAAALE